MIGLAHTQPLHRRSLLLGLGMAPIGVWPRLAAAADYKDYFSETVPHLRDLGTQPATEPEVAEARRLADAAPKTDPLAMMRYFASLKDVNADGELYRGGWRTRWNPLLVLMFDATQTEPSGDLTPWCAASLNWCLARAGLRTTGSASSSSFRRFPSGAKPADPPQPGDVVVFKSANPVLAKAGRGHVGLFVSQTETCVEVAGGNQINMLGHHEFSTKPILKQGRALVLEGIYPLAAYKQPSPRP